MAVSTITNLFAGQTGSRTRDKRTYEGVWMVQVTDPADGPRIVTDALKSWLGKSWTNFCNDVDSSAKCVSLVPTRVPDTRLIWTVKGTWETPEGGDGNSDDGGGKDGDDPTKWRDEVEWGAVKVMVPVERAINRTDLTGVGRPEGSEGPLVNAAGEVFDPPPEREDSHAVLRITKYQAFFPEMIADNYANAINSGPFAIAKPGLTVMFPKYTAKMEPITGSLNWHKRTDGIEVFYWKNTYELHRRRGGWREELVNRGRNRRAGAEDPSGLGGQISAHSPGGRPRMEWRPDLARIRDDDDFPTGPVLLDLKGQPLPKHEDAVYLKYSFYPELDFSALNL